MSKLISKMKNRFNGVFLPIIRDRSGDQMTGWLIVVLLVVVTGAVFLILYQGSITEIWNGIINKMKTVFGI